MCGSVDQYNEIHDKI